MTPRVSYLLTAALLLSGSRAAVAQVTVTPAIVVGNLSVTSAPAAGQNPSAATKPTAGTYKVITVNKDPNTKIKAQLTGTIPAGMTLTITLAAPTGATSAGAVALVNGTPVTVVTGIPGRTNQSGLNISYTLTAPASSGNLASTPLSILFTLTP